MTDGQHRGYQGYSSFDNDGEYHPENGIRVPRRKKKKRRKGKGKDTFPVPEFNIDQSVDENGPPTDRFHSLPGLENKKDK